MRGPAPKPPAVKAQLAPVRSKRGPALAKATQAQPQGVQPPAWLDADGLIEWNARASSLSAAKLLTEIDAGAFARYCVNFARWRAMVGRLQLEGEDYLVESAHGTYRRPHPLAARADALEVRLIALEDRFGLNPTERQRIMAARAQTGVSGDLFSQPPRAEGPEAGPTPPAGAAMGPIGMLN